MKILFNTKVPEAPASFFYIQKFKKAGLISFNDLENAHKYDICIFMTYKEDWEDIKRIKEVKPDIKIGICDPRGSSILQIIDLIDFFIVDSIEMKDFYSNFSKPVFIYPDIPDLDFVNKNHVNKEKIILAYHGNRIHISSMFPNITCALDRLSQVYNIELWLVYNADQGLCNIGLPSRIKTRHIKWSENVYSETLSQADIGICPSLMPIKNPPWAKRRVGVSKYFNENNDDYLIRFKMPSNNGRAVVFGYLGIPVVVDFLPSFLQLIKDEHNGLIAYSSGGWYHALEKLILSTDERNRLSENMRCKIRREFDFEIINTSFADFLNGIISYDAKLPVEKVLQPANSFDYRKAILVDNFRRKRKALIKFIKARIK